DSPVPRRASMPTRREGIRKRRSHCESCTRVPSPLCARVFLFLSAFDGTPYHSTRADAGAGQKIQKIRSPLPPTCLHLLQHGGGRPAIELEVVALLIGAERRAGQHAGLAIDLVVVIAARREHFLHADEIGRRQLRDLAPRRLE